MMTRIGWLGGIAALALWGTALWGTTQAAPTNFSFTGNFEFDDDVAVFDFTVGAPSNVVLRTYGYAGGTNAAGTSFDAGGLDPILSLFNLGTGDFIAGNDDGGTDVGTDPNTLQQFDAFLAIALGPGSYRVALTQYDNCPIGATCDEPTTRIGEPTFTSEFGCTNGIFCDNSGVDPFNNRTSFWALDILGVETEVAVALSEPAGLAIIGIGLLGLGWARRARR
ncbi:MAG: DVUA0089 family protein [Alphaproteobacteria bacterium]